MNLVKVTARSRQCQRSRSWGLAELTHELSKNPIRGQSRHPATRWKWHHKMLHAENWLSGRSV